MYENIGKKIKEMAKVVAIVLAVLAVIGGMVMIAVDSYLLVPGLLTMLLGPVLAWLGSFVLYGFGELVDKTCDIERKMAGAPMHDEQLETDSERRCTLERLRASGAITEEEYYDVITKIQKKVENKND